MTALSPPSESAVRKRRNRPTAIQGQASLDRPLRVAARRDLTSVAQRHRGVRYWIVKDPVGLKYYRFPEEEHALLQMLDGHATLQGLVERFEAEFPPRKIAPAEVQKFIGRLHEQGLIVVDRPGQGRALRARETEINRRQRRAAMTNILTIRFPGIDPEKTLTRLDSWVGWIFSPAAALAFATLGLAALMLLATNFHAVMLKLPSLPAFFASENLILLAATMIGCKVCHEFGHGLAAKRFGGECHRMGFLLLVFMPAMYCDVSDSWLMPSKWKKMVIAAAGVYVELILASVATFLWWCTQEGVVHNLCLAVMVASSASTVLVNANPLMRFDGYYVLADWLEIPNLAARSREELRRLLLSVTTGAPAANRPPTPPHTRRWLLAYGIASQAYRVLLVTLIAITLYGWLAPHGLRVIADLLVAMLLVAMIGVPAKSFTKYLLTPGRLRTMKPRRIATSLALIAAVAAAALSVPLARTVRCDVLIDYRDARLVYADPGGEVDELFVKVGDRVEAGQPIARLKNSNLEMEIARLETEKNRVLAELNSLEQTQLVSYDAGRKINAHRDKIRFYDEQLRHRNEQHARLLIRSPIVGEVLPLPARPGLTDGRREASRRWKANLLDQRNVGGTIPSGEWVCQIGDPTRLKATLLLEGVDSGDIRAGQPVEIRLQARPLDTIDTEVQQLASESSTTEQPGAGPTWDVQLQSDRTDELRSSAPAGFRATAPVSNASGLLCAGMTGKARVRIGNATLWEILWLRAWQQLQF